jgi:hypothetical protein
VENGGTGCKDNGEMAWGGAGIDRGEIFEESGLAGWGGELGGELVSGGAGGFGEWADELEIEFSVDFD